ncbi:putative G-protein coupled receptor 21 [Trichoplax sp. H2]|nr:putative G-protein coupled receptor 21 [Trichoplax sp. H2]|eukprot:RDD43466.1 putative G-protein coupled receptor 21 [Trichoplax sp. H2]
MNIHDNISEFMENINGAINGSISKDWLLPKRSIVIDISFIILALVITVSNVKCVYKIGKSFRKYKSNTFYSAARLLMTLLVVVNTSFLILISSIIVPSQLVGYWIGGIYTCNTVGVLIEIWTNFVTLLATIISLERYLAIKKPFRYNNLCSPWKIKLLLIFILIISSLVGILSLFLNRFALIAYVPVCQIVIDNVHDINSLEYATLWLDMSCFIPCCSILLLTTMEVLLELKQMSVRVRNLSVTPLPLSQYGHNRDLRQTKRLARIVIMITVLHLLCWIPQRICTYIQRLSGIDQASYVFYSHVSVITKMLDMLVVPLAIFWSQQKCISKKRRSRIGKSLPLVPP